MALSEITTDDGFSIGSSERSADEMQSDLAPSVEPSTNGSGTTETETASTATAPVVDKKPDGRTREGKKHSIQAEIDDLTSRRTTTQREFEETQAKLETARQELASLESRRNGAADRGTQSPTATEPSRATTPSVDAGDDPEPQFESFLNEADAATAYTRALARWEGRREAARVFEARQAIAREREQIDSLVQHVGAKQKAAQERLAEASKLNPTLMETVSPIIERLKPAAYWVLKGEVNKIDGASAIADCILDSDVPDRLLLRLSDEREFSRIAALPVHLAHRAMGKLEAEEAYRAADRGPAGKPVIASAAPPPTKPLGGAPRVTVSDSSDSDFNDSSEIAVDRYLAAQLKRKA